MIIVKNYIIGLFLALTVSGIRPAVSMAQLDPDSLLIRPDPPQYGKPYKKLPDRRDVIIYQVNIRPFSKEGDFNGVTARLDSIKALGINVVYLMPIYPLGILKAFSSPYCVRDYEGIDSTFGTLEALRALVAGAHQRNMAVMLDWVGNHTSYDNPWTKNKSWYLLDSAGTIRMPPGFDWTDVAQLNFKNADMRTAMIKSMKYWVLTANIDGFRCDYADGPPADFWKQAIDSLRNIQSRQLLFLAEGSRADLFPDGFDYEFGFKFYDNLKKIYKNGRSVKSIDTLNTRDYTYAMDGQQMVRYTTNHDVNSSDGTPLELFGGKAGSLAAFVIIAYMKGVPFIYNGQEMGLSYQLKAPFTKSKIDWIPNPDMTSSYKKILAFRNGNEAVRRGELTSYSSDDVCVFTKTEGSKQVLVISNLRNKAISYPAPSVLTGSSWTDAFTKAPINIGSIVNLPPYGYMVLQHK